MNILIVDDEYYIVKGIQEKIDWAKLGFDEVLIAFDAKQARKLFSQKKTIHYMIVDVEMPDESGLDLIRWVNANGYSTISIILTGHSLFDYAQKAVKLHCFSYLLKPINYSILEEELKSAIESGGHDFQDDEDASGPVRQAKEYISRNIGSAQLSRSEIANYVHLSPDYLSYVFHKEEGQSLSVYILNERFELAKRLLSSTGLSVEEISEKAGFSDQSYFAKQFKRFVGITPRQFRQLHDSRGRTTKSNGAFQNQADQ